MIVGQEIVTNGKLRLARAVAGYEVEQARLAWDAQRRRVLNDVRTGYYEVLLAQKTVEVNERLVRIGEEVVQVNEKLRAAMEVSRPVLLQSRIEANTARLSLIEAQNTHQAAWRRLATVLGRPELHPAPLTGEPDHDLPEFTWEETLARLLTHSPELAQAYVGVERARCELARQCAEQVPNFEIGAWVKYDETAWQTLADVEIAVPLPLINRNQGAIMEARANLAAAEREVRRVELDLRNRLASTFERYAIAQRQVEIYTSSIIPDAKASLELLRTGYREGEFGYIDLLVAQTTFFDVSLSSLDRLKELWAASVELEGLLLGGGLERPE
jgi:cobalt-zinc-cadmium efflux system outer membrane protein